MKPINFKPLSHNEIMKIQQSMQVFHDCYLVSSLHALTKSKNGRKVLANNIQRTMPNGVEDYKIKFPDLEDVFVSHNDIDNLCEIDKYPNTKLPKPLMLPAIKAIEIAMNKLIAAHPGVKPLICRFATCTEAFEFNFASNFMKLFTGKKPYSLNEKTVKMSLKSHAKEAYNLFEKLGNSNEYSFIAGTGIVPGDNFRRWHCYVVDKVDYDTKLLTLINKRDNIRHTVSFDKAIKELKYFVGYFGAE